MPELPEVEVTRLGLVERLDGARLLALHTGKPLRWPLGIAPQALAGACIGRLQRRGKYLWMPLVSRRPADAGPPDEAGEGGAGGEAGEPAAAQETPGLLIHLGMSGSLRLEDSPVPAGVHDHVQWQTDRGWLRLHDPRRFGAVVWSPGRDVGPAARLLAGLGVEPLGPDFDAAVLRRGLQGRRVSVKQALLAGDVVVGVGNIYCSEALFEAGIDPRTPAGRLGPQRCARLAEAVRDVLQRAVVAGGSTLRDFRDAQGHDGSFQLQARVYGRDGQPCRRCGATLRRIVQGQRATYFCPGCQHR